jgi:hypothetical protein
MEILAEQTFSRDFSTDTKGSLILNESAAKRIDWTPEDAKDLRQPKTGPIPLVYQQFWVGLAVCPLIRL